MADRKDSDLAIKSALVDGDLIPVLDSETAVDAEKNKTVAVSTIENHVIGANSWTPMVLGETLINPRGYYQKTKTMVSLKWSFTMPITASGSTFLIQGLPFTPVASGAGKPSGYFGFIIKSSGGSIDVDNVSGIGASGVSILAFSAATPNGRPLSYFSNEDVTGSISFITA